MKSVKYILTLYLIVSLICCSQQGIFLTIDRDYLKRATESALPRIENPDLKLTNINDDYLPSGWDYQGEETFYEIDRIAAGDKWLSIYYMKAGKGNKVIDIRLATYVADSLIYNLPIWTNADNNTNITLIQRADGKITVEMYRDQLRLSTYLPEEGIFNLE